ncbi:unnamed protein product [Dovyalis caffra]|uniref:Uncharacterized protein n=1 Tax=Dovyalis caffra TaxID=77055 RepID=A0AAV1SQR9_9ROSI|nr:unnamed protein product [Dovyalis caffra]
MEEGRMLGFEAKGRVWARPVQRGKGRGYDETDEGLRGRRPRSWCPCKVVTREKGVGVVMAISEGERVVVELWARGVSFGMRERTRVLVSMAAGSVLWVMINSPWYKEM